MAGLSSTTTNAYPYHLYLAFGIMKRRKILLSRHHFKASAKSKLVSDGKHATVNHRSSKIQTSANSLRRREIAARIGLDVAVLVLVSIVYFVLEFVTPPFKRGFFCDTERIKYPFLKSTVGTSVMIVCGTLIGLAIIIPMEMLWRRWYSADPSYRRPAARWRVRPIVYYLYNYIGTYTFINFVCQTLTNVTKLSVGSLRPHFLHVCQPDFSKINCSEGYISDFNCTGSDLALAEEARKSFVSGHASFTFTCSVYLILYLQWRLIWRAAVLLRVTLQCGLLGLTVWVCCTRLQDNMHHWEDIAAGGAMGIATGIVGAFSVSNMFKHEQPRSRSHSTRKSESSTSGSEDSGCDATSVLQSVVGEMASTKSEKP